MKSRKELMRKIETLKLYNEVLLTMYRTVRGFKHNFGNFIQVVDGYAKMGNMEGIRNVCSRSIDNYKNLNVLGILSPNVFKSEVLYILLANKILDANKETICIDIEVLMDFENIEERIDFNNYIKILDCILTYAITSVKSSEWHFMNIIFSDKDDYIYTTIEFSYPKDRFQLDKKNQELEKIAKDVDSIKVNFFAEDKCICQIKVKENKKQN